MADTKHTPAQIKGIIKDLTNGVGEKPYCRRVDGQMVVFVADDQELCRVALIDEYDEQIAQAICESGLLIDTLQRQRDMLLLILKESNVYAKLWNGVVVAICMMTDDKQLGEAAAQCVKNMNSYLRRAEAAIAACKEDRVEEQENG